MFLFLSLNGACILKVKKVERTANCTTGMFILAFAPSPKPKSLFDEDGGVIALGAVK